MSRTHYILARTPRTISMSCSPHLASLLELWQFDQLPVLGDIEPAGTLSPLLLDKAVREVGFKTRTMSGSKIVRSRKIKHSPSIHFRINVRRKQIGQCLVKQSSVSKSV